MSIHDIHSVANVRQQGSLHHQRGAISVVFIFTLPIMLGMLALSVLMSMYLLTITRAGQASDAASLACGYAQRADASVMEGFIAYYQPRFVISRTFDSTPATGSNRCDIAASYGFSNIMASALPREARKFTTLTSHSTSTTRLVVNSTVKPMDLALVLDISGSMSRRLPQLKTIIDNAVQDIQLQQNTKSVGQVRFSIVPFDTGVGVVDAPWLTESKGKVTCVDGMSYQDRTPNANMTVDDLGAPASTLTIRTTQASQWLGACSLAAPVLPLTDDLDKVRSHVNALATNGSTSSYQGLIWGARTLIPQWQQEWKIPPVTSNDLTQRLVLFTDGADNGGYFDELVKAGLCQVIQDQFSIEMSFIGFGVSRSRLRQFETCAGQTGKVYDAQNTAELETFFKEALDTETSAALILEER